MWKQISVHMSLGNKTILCALKSGLLTVTCEMEMCLMDVVMIEMSFHWQGDGGLFNLNNFTLLLNQVVYLRTCSFIFLTSFKLRKDI